MEMLNNNYHVLSVYYMLVIMPGTTHTLFFSLMIALQGEIYLDSFYRWGK